MGGQGEACGAAVAVVTCAGSACPEPPGGPQRAVPLGSATSGKVGQGHDLSLQLELKQERYKQASYWKAAIKSGKVMIIA